MPVGQYSEEIFTYMDLWDKMNEENKITFGTNVREVLAQVEEGSVDCGVVYSTDAAISDKVEEMCIRDRYKGRYHRIYSNRPCATYSGRKKRRA